MGAGLSRALLNPVTEVAAGLTTVFLLGVAIWSGLHGTEAPDRNFALTFLFVTCWLGFPLFSVLLGDVFSAFSPWRAIGRAVGGGFRALTGQRPAHLLYPERLGRWPGCLEPPPRSCLPPSCTRWCLPSRFPPSGSPRPW